MIESSITPERSGSKEKEGLGVGGSKGPIIYVQGSARRGNAKMLKVALGVSHPYASTLKGVDHEDPAGGKGRIAT